MVESNITHLDLTDCSNCRDLCFGPIIFPCGHLCCRKCVRQLIVREGLPAHCSSCHEIIPLVQGETISDIIDNMCKDLVIEKMVCELLRQERKTCDLCHETKVTHVCLDCRHYLCNICSGVHSVSELSYAHKQQTLPTTLTTAEIQSQSDSSGLEALCRNIQRCQVAEETTVDTQTTRNEVEMILYDQICQLKNSEKDVDKLITSLQNIKVRLIMKQQILGMYAAELAKHDQSLVQTEPFLNRVRQIKKENFPPLLHLAALEGCIRDLGDCGGYMPSERPSTPQVNADAAREAFVLGPVVQINIKKKIHDSQATSQTTEESPLTFEGVDCIKTPIRGTTINTDVGTVQLETISDPRISTQAAEDIVVAKIDWSNDRIQKSESERRKMKAFEKNNTIRMKLQKDIIRVTRQVEDERRKWSQRIEEERSTAKEQQAEKEVKLRKLEDEMNTVIKQLEEELSRLEEEKSRLTSQLDEERTRREADLKVMNEKHKEEMNKVRSEMKAFEERNKTQVMRLEKDRVRVTKQLEDERGRWTQLIEEERSRATEQLAEKEIKLRQLEDKMNTGIKQLEEERSRLEEERNRLTSQLDEKRTKREADLKVMNAKNEEEMKKEIGEMKAFEEKNKRKIMQIEKDIIRVTKQLEEERKRWTQLIEEENSKAKEQLEKRAHEQEEKKNELKQLVEERSRLTLQLEEEKSRLTLLLEEERKRREADLKAMNEKHREEMKQERKNFIRFVMRLEGSDTLLSDVLGRVEDGHLSQIVRQLLHDFHIRLLGVDCGLNFLMEVPASLWGEVVQEQLQGVLSDLVPETDRQEVTWSRVTHLESSHDSDLRLGGTILAPETDRQEVTWPRITHLESSHDSDLRLGGTMLAPETATYQSVSARHRNHSNLILPPANDNDVSNARALQRVLHGMLALADDCDQKEVMFVVSQLQFDNYLDEPGFAPIDALLPHPRTLLEHFRQQHYDKSDFDVLIIHRQHGLFILEINSMGEDFGLGEMTEEQEDAVLIETVEAVTKQLNKAEDVLRHLTSDLQPKINITKSLVLPNVNSSQLQQTINRYPSAGQVLCQCLGVQSVVDAVKLCLLSDQLSDNQMSSVINDNSLQALREWWQHLVRASGNEPLYEQLLARLCGPTTTVIAQDVTAPRLIIRTLGEAVSESGERVARLVLFSQQVDILNRSSPRTFLSGPPGTGKTTVLIMQGLTWLQCGHDVHVVSTWDGSRATTIIIEHQLQETAKTSTTSSHVHRHQFDLWEDKKVETAAGHLKSLSESRQLCVIADEVVRDNRNRELFAEFCNQLIVQVPGVFIWGASVYHDVRPLCLEEVKLTTPISTPPVVVREVMESWQIKSKRVHDYTVSDAPVSTDGPPVMQIKHYDGQSGHTKVWPLDCVECGHEVARVLTELDVGRTGDRNGPLPLQYRDVLVLCENYPTDDQMDSNGQVTTKVSGLVLGLRDRHLPVRVVKKGDEAAIRDTALGVGDLVTVANWRDVQGLERKVVVVVREIGRFEFSDRFQAMSRCTSQLVLIDWC